MVFEFPAKTYVEYFHNPVAWLLFILSMVSSNFMSKSEPTKGEYKAVFGKQENVSVYGTNPNLSDYTMLRLNPFRFPKSVHILEHLDRLIEIFNVCWPMYAAMPAILKDAVERSYVAAGWDLVSSTNKYDDRLYPIPLSRLNHEELNILLVKVFKYFINRI